MKKKVVFASTDRIVEHREEVDEVLWHMATMLKEPDDTEENWLKYCFVSDESSLGDFFYRQGELEELGKKTGLEGLQMRSLICNVADALNKKRATPPRIN